MNDPTLDDGDELDFFDVLLPILKQLYYWMKGL